MKKRGQIHLSFGMIFSMFLIAVFVFFALKILFSFISLNKCVDLQNFKIELEKKINEAKNSQSTMLEMRLNLGNDVSHICFVNLSSSKKGNFNFPDKYNKQENFFIKFSNSKKEKCKQFSNERFENLNITEITKQQNPRCFANGKKIIIRKDLYSRLVTIN